MLAALTLSAPSPVHQAPCNHSTYDQDDAVPPGDQPGSGTTIPCGSSSLTVHVTISAEGSVQVVDVGTSGALSIKLETPASCPSQRLNYSGEIIACEGTGSLHCWNCDPHGADVKVTLYQNHSPCPTLPPADLLGVLNSVGAALMDGAPVTIPCGELKDVTEEELDEGSRVRKSARISKCDPCESPAELPSRDGLNAYVESTGSRLFIYQGKLTALDLDTILAGFEPMSDFGTFDVDPALTAHLLGEAPDVVPAPLEQALLALGNPEFVDDVVCEVRTTYLLNSPSFQGEATRSFVVMGSLRSNGDFSLRLPETIRHEGKRVSFTEHWASVDGDIFFAEEGELSGVVYPLANRSAAIALSTRLWFVNRLQQWMSDPFQVSASSAMLYSVEELEGQILRIRCAIDWSYAPEAVENVAAELLLGGECEYEVDVSGTQPIVNSMRREHSSGMVELFEFNKYMDVRPGSSRPMSMTVQEYWPDGTLSRETEFEFTSMDRTAEAGRELAMPQPADDVWYIRVE
jgi:hypothetical protein